MLTKRGSSFESLGEMSSLFMNGETIKFPEMIVGQQVAGMTSQETDLIAAGLGINILGNIIGAMGGSKLGLENQFSHARTLSFTFKNITLDSVDITALDAYLTDADVNPFSTHISALLESDDIFIVTSILRSNSFSVSAQSKNKDALKIDVPVIKEIVGANINIEIDDKTDSILAFEGAVPLAFGFKAVRLYYSDGKYSAFETVDPSGGALTHQQTAFSFGENKGSYLITDTAVVNI